MPDAFNLSGASGLAALDPANDALLTHASITVRTGGKTARRADYVFPELDGSGTQHFGLQPRVITWDLVYVAYGGSGGGQSAANRRLFEAKIETYLGTAQRFRLETAQGDAWDYVELTQVEPEAEPILTTSAGEEFHSVRLTFRNMQP